VNVTEQGLEILKIRQAEAERKRLEFARADSPTRSQLWPGAHVVEINGEPVKAKRPKAPKRQPGPNKSEQRFWDQSIYRVELAFEPVTLKLGSDCRYTPDFGFPSTGPTRFYEVKAGDRKTGKPRVEDDALVKIKVAAKMFPAYRFILTWEVNGVWQEKEIPKW
jgi:hypothetical protein